LQNHEDLVLLKAAFNFRKIRMLIWALDYQPDNGEEPILLTEKFENAMLLIDHKWKDSFLIGLSHVLLKNWQTIRYYKSNGFILTELLLSKAKIYNGGRKDILKFSSMMSGLISPSGPVDLAKNLLKKKLTLNQASQLIHLKDSVLGYEYFTDVSYEYMEHLKNKKINEVTIRGVYNFLKLHNHKKVTLIICSKIINDNLYGSYVDVMKNATVTMISDPIQSHAWRHSELSNKQQELVFKAKQRLNILLNKNFIKIFFEKMVEDYRRKSYWLKFIDKIDDIKFAGNRANYQYLKNIESVSKYVNKRYKITVRNQKTCALIIYSKDYVFVEFSDTGALYIYKQNHFDVNLNSLNGIQDLKTWSTYDYACKNSPYSSGYVDLNPEGRITHQGFWEDRFDIWMRNYYDA
jgi:hypothetical protein